MTHYHLIMKEEEEKKKKGGESIRKGKGVNGERNGKNKQEKEVKKEEKKEEVGGKRGQGEMEPMDNTAVSLGTKQVAF